MTKPSQWTLDSRTSLKCLDNGLFEFTQKDQTVTLTKYQLRIVLKQIANLLEDK